MNQYVLPIAPLPIAVAGQKRKLTLNSASNNIIKSHNSTAALSSVSPPVSTHNSEEQLPAPITTFSLGASSGQAQIILARALAQTTMRTQQQEQQLQAAAPVAPAPGPATAALDEALPIFGIDAHGYVSLFICLLVCTTAEKHCHSPTFRFLVVLCYANNIQQR